MVCKSLRMVGLFLKYIGGSCEVPIESVACGWPRCLFEQCLRRRGVTHFLAEVFPFTERLNFALVRVGCGRQIP